MNIRNFIIRLIINMIAIGITANILPGISVNGGVGTLFLIALVFGVINAILKPVLVLLTCPAVILSLGLFILVINAALLLLTAAVLGSSFTVDGFGSAFIGGIIMGITAIVVEFVLAQIGLAEDK